MFYTKTTFLFRKIIIFLIKGYRLFISPDHGIFKRHFGVCRFYPTCSDYSIRAIERFGVFKGALLGAKRILKCHPLQAGGIDDVPERWTLKQT